MKFLLSKISNFYSLNLKMYKHLWGKLPHKYRETQLCACPPMGLPHRTNWPSLSTDSISAELSLEWKFICKFSNEYSWEFVNTDNVAKTTEWPLCMLGDSPEWRLFISSFQVTLWRTVLLVVRLIYVLTLCVLFLWFHWINGSLVQTELRPCLVCQTPGRKWCVS